MKKIKTVECNVVKANYCALDGLDLNDHTYSLLKDIERNFSIGERVIIVSKSDYESLVANQKKPKTYYGI